MQAYNQSINDLDRELDHLKNAFEVKASFCFLSAIYLNSMTFFSRVILEICMSN